MKPDTHQTVHDSRYWRANSGLTLLVCTLWLMANFGVLFYAREIVALSDWPLSTFALVQGLMLAYVILIVIFNLIVARFKRLRQGQTNE